MVKQKWQVQKKIETITLCVYFGWLVFVVAMWRTRWMVGNGVASGLLLLFAVLIYVLLCFIRRFPQVRMTRSGFSQKQAVCAVRARFLWLSSLKLVFTCGFAGMSVSLLFSDILRLVFTLLFMLSLLAVTIRFLLAYRAVILSEPVHPPRG